MLRLPLLSRRVRWALAALIAGFALAASLVPGTGASGVPATFLAISADKWLHALGYAVLAAAFAHALDGPDRRPRAVLGGAFLLALAVGAGAELLQAPVPGRTADAADLAADAVGAGVALAVYRAGHRAVRFAPEE